MKRTTVWIATLVLLLGLVLLASVWLILTRARAPQPTPALRAGVLAARTPTPQPTASVPGNLLANPSFELPYAPQQFGEINVAQGWKAWYLDIPPCRPWRSDCYIPCPTNCIENGACLKDYGCMWARPEFVPMMYAQFTYRVHTGETSQKYFSYARMHEAGMYQQVHGVVPGSLLEFSAWFETWMCFDYSQCDYGRVSDAPGDMHLRIGIDPTGGTVPTSTNVIWSPEAPAFDHWVKFSVQANALSDVVTVFTHSRAEWAYAHPNNDVYLDDASLIVVGPPADFSIQPSQPELGQATTVQVTSPEPFANVALAVTDPTNAPVVASGGSMTGAGTGPYTWAWQFTPTVSGTYQLAFSADGLPAPVTSTVRAIAAAHLTVQPSTAWLSQTVTIQASAYYDYPSQHLTVTDPLGNPITPTDDGKTGTAALLHTWRMASLVTGTHLITFSADLLPAPVTAQVNVASLAGVDAYPVVPPVGTTVSFWAFAYYPYPNVAMASTDPQGGALPLTYLGQSSGPPYVWTWIGTPVITGTHVYTFTADGLDMPARGLVFAGGSAVYMPVIFKQ